MPHRAKAEHWSHAWLAVCQDCDWLGSDYSDEGPAAEEAQMHERGERQPWDPEKVVPWNSKSRAYYLREP